MVDVKSTAPTRRELTELVGASNRVVRYLEGLAPAIDESRTLIGDGNPEGAVPANASRLYIDRLTGNLYKNTNPDANSMTGWVL